MCNQHQPLEVQPPAATGAPVEAQGDALDAEIIRLGGAENPELPPSDPRRWANSTAQLSQLLAIAATDEAHHLELATIQWNIQQSIRAELRMRNIDPDAQLRSAMNALARRNDVAPF